MSGMQCPHCAGTGTLQPEAITFGTMIVAHRKAKSWTQQDLADAVKMSRGQIANIEVDRSDTSLSTVKKFATALGVGMKDLMP